MAQTDFTPGPASHLQRDNAELIACPFCGSRDIEVSDGGRGLMFYVRCNSCRATGPGERCAADAMPAWRARVALSPQPPAETGDDDAEWLRQRGRISRDAGLQASYERIASRLEAPSPQPDTDVVQRARLLAAEIMAAMRQARFPKEYAHEAHDEFEALTLAPMLTAALNAIANPDGDLSRGISASDQAASA